MLTLAAFKHSLRLCLKKVEDRLTLGSRTTGERCYETKLWASDPKIEVATDDDDDDDDDDVDDFIATGKRQNLICVG
jgi:hypothetical protein